MVVVSKFGETGRKKKRKDRRKDKKRQREPEMRGAQWPREKAEGEQRRKQKERRK